MKIRMNGKEEINTRDIQKGSELSLVSKSIRNAFGGKKQYFCETRPNMWGLISSRCVRVGVCGVCT